MRTVFWRTTGFTTGTGSNISYNGHPLAKFGDVVVVTLNHRLGCLGYLSMAHIGAPPEFAQAGVAGMMDCVLALEWVRDHIAQFGGDPSKVMIFGQSGGGAKVSHLLAMPSARGLFHRAAIQSSGWPLRAVTRECATRAAEQMLAQIGLTRKRVAELQQVPVEMMLSVQSQPRRAGRTGRLRAGAGRLGHTRVIRSIPTARRSPQTCRSSSARRSTTRRSVEPISISMKPG